MQLGNKINEIIDYLNNYEPSNTPMQMQEVDIDTLMSHYDTTTHKFDRLVYVFHNRFNIGFIFFPNVEDKGYLNNPKQPYYAISSGSVKFGFVSIGFKDYTSSGIHWYSFSVELSGTTSDRTVSDSTTNDRDLPNMFKFYMEV